MIGGRRIVEPWRAEVIGYAFSLVGQDHHCCEEAAPGYDLAHVSWCAIFALHCLRRCHLTELTWADVKAMGHTEGWLQRTADPLPGDIGLIVDTNGDGKPEYHHALVVDPKLVRTIDGNSIGRKVCDRTRPPAMFDVFYSIESLRPVYGGR